MSETLSKDLFRYSRSTSLSSCVKQFMGNPSFRFLVVLRICKNTSLINPLGIFFRLYYKRLRIKFGFQIPFQTSIGAGLFLGHFGGIVINQKTVIGENCNISHGVTLGQVNRGPAKGYPVIGDRVWIGPNSVIVGNVKIGNDALIAPLSYVIEDVPDKAVVMGNPAKIVSYNGSEGYVNNILQ